MNAPWRSATSLARCWQVLESGARELGYSRIDARLAGQRFGTFAPRHSQTAYWQMRLSLPNQDFVNITQCEGSVQPMMVVPFAEIVRRSLPLRLQQIADSTASMANLAEALQSGGLPEDRRPATAPYAVPAELQDHESNVVGLRRALGE